MDIVLKKTVQTGISWPVGPTGTPYSARGKKLYHPDLPNYVSCEMTFNWSTVIARPQCVLETREGSRSTIDFDTELLAAGLSAQLLTQAAAALFAWTCDTYR
jgi:hypothetical protein